MTSKDGTMLFDFTDPAIFGEEQAASWWESSDTVRWAFWNFESIGEYRLICCWMAISYLTSTNYVIRSAGMSKAVFSLQRSIRFQRAVFFALINPQVAALTHCQILQHVCNSNLISQARSLVLMSSLYMGPCSPSFTASMITFSLFSQTVQASPEWKATSLSVRSIFR